MSSKTIQDPPTSQLIFPNSSSTNIHKTLASIKRSTLSITNRLHSLEEDSNYIISVSENYHLPLVANERCGSWYIPPELKAGSVYFKSTDGHMGNWAFSLRRLNIQLLSVVEEMGGCIIVDSTRRGKSMSDAFSKTIPIWCYVLNRVLFPSITSSHQLYTPSDLISSSESSQIQTKLPNFVTNFQNLNLPLSKLRKSISKPLRPFWIRPNIPFPNNKNIIPFNTDIFHPLILCTASRFENVENWYVQGAGDDSEGWANGLTANLYWTNREELRRTCEGELEGLITRLVSSSNDEESREELGYKLIEPTSNIFIGTSAVVGTAATAGLSIRDPNAENFDLIIDCFSIVVEKKKKKKLKDENKKEEPSSNTTTTQQQNPTTPSPNHLTLPCGPGKQGSRALRSQLPIAIKALLSLITNLENQQSPPKQSQQQPPQNEQKHQQQQQQNQPTNPPKILLLSPPNTDLALGVGLTILSLFHDSSGNFISTRSEIENATYLSSSSSSSSTSTSSTSSSNINNNKNNNDNDDNDTNDDNTTNINTSTSPPSEIKEKLSSTPITKHLIRQRLTWLTTSLPHINLSRSTLQSVNSFLISPPPPHSSPTPINDR